MLMQYNICPRHFIILKTNNNFYLLSTYYGKVIFYIQINEEKKVLREIVSYR